MNRLGEAVSTSAGYLHPRIQPFGLLFLRALRVLRGVVPLRLDYFFSAHISFAARTISSTITSPPSLTYSIALEDGSQRNGYIKKVE